MTADCNTIQAVLLRRGTAQADRFKTDLNPDSIQIHGFGIEDWMAFAYNFAKHVNYFDLSNWQVPNGDWQAFFKDENETLSLLRSLEESDELTPHLTLFICFLKLIDLSAGRMNSLTKKHLDFFYEDILKIDKLPALGDKVHVLFELSKNVYQERISEGTLLNGGKDEIGKLRSYELPSEFVTNAAAIKELKNVYFDPDFVDPVTNITQNRYYMKAAEIANSLDGKGDTFTDDAPTWYAFGYNHNRTDSKYAELDNAKLGFAVSSHVLSLSEGTRHVQIDVNFTGTINALTFAQLKNSIDVYYTSEKNWVGPLSLVQNNPLGTIGVYKTEVLTSAKKVRFYVTIDSGLPAATNYAKKVHAQKFATTHPVFRFILKPLNPVVLDTYRLLSKQISSIDIKVEAQGVKNLVLDNDQGTLNPSKPLYPFTTVPNKGSNFSIYHEEIFTKQWDQVKVNINWKNVPEDLPGWYTAYEGPYRLHLSRAIYDGAVTGVRAVSGLASSVSLYSITNKIVSNANYFQVTRSIKYDNNWSQLGVVSLFTQTNPYTSQLTFPGSAYANNTTEALRISLNQSFLHELYPRLYALSLITQTPSTIIPNEPYTPFAEDISVSYTAHDSIDLSNIDEETFAKRSVQFYHEHPFGQSEEHAYLKSLLSFIGNSCTLTPVYCRGGEFYIGIENADQLQTISLLFQVFEGSENPLFSSFESSKVSWDILAENEWKPLDSTLLSKNGIDNFLQSGIIEFKVPKEATTNNTVLPEGLFWIRAKMLKPYDAVCRILGVHAQAALAEFVDNGNELSHLDKGLPAGTISKFIQRPARIKSITQPYNSFGGKPEETQKDYYRRVSERLRHKNRSITLWDYEHMVLQEFPDIYNVKCLNHTCDKSYIAAGHVTLVVIPDTINKNVYDIYQPRVSTAYLNEIKTFIDQFNSLHVKQHVINPDYEPIKIDLKVKFREGYDEALYKIQLNEDITKLLSPWAFDHSINVQFGNTLHRSVLIEYIEDLAYVDYVQDVLMLTSSSTAIQNYTPSSPKAIMVSAKNHSISTDIISCESTLKTITETCQQ